jgi:hypothetical protein
MKKFLEAIYGFVTDANGDGDIVKLAGAALVIIAVGRFAFTGSFDAVAFGAGAGAAVAGKALDAVIPKTPGA